jgi:hypothetical protein
MLQLHKEYLFGTVADGATTIIVTIHLFRHLKWSQLLSIE